MNIHIKTTNVTLTPEISDYANKRMNKVLKLLQNDTTAQCDIELARTTSHHQKGDIFKAEVHIVAINKNLYASAEKEDLYVAIDIVRDEILRELNQNKEKQVSFVRRQGARVKDMIRGMWPWKRSLDL